MNIIFEYKVIFAIIVIVILMSLQYTLNKILFEVRQIRKYISKIKDE